jgi:hypothetical protein
MNIISRIIIKLSQQSRLHEYENILLTAKEHAYQVCSIYEWLESDKKGKYLILRHDVDMDLQGARNMFEIEKRLGLHSTYYFRNSTKNYSLIKEMQKAAFETGYHYETIADYAKIKGILHASNLHDYDYAKCKSVLKHDIYEWKNMYGNLHTICAHGDKRNRLLKVPNRVLFDKKLRDECSVYYDACDIDILQQVDTYISDSSAINNHKWKKGISPQQAIAAGDRTIMLLTHPTHWNYNLLKNIRVLYRGFLEDFINYVCYKDRFI